MVDKPAERTVVSLIKKQKGIGLYGFDIKGICYSICIWIISCMVGGDVMYKSDILSYNELCDRMFLGEVDYICR